jgi:outer membrane receptor for monomeric catechols
MFPPVRSLSTLRALVFILGLPLLASLPASLAAATPATKQKFDLPENSVEKSLKRLADQAGVEVLYPTNFARDVRTRAVRGEFTPREALERMLAGTGLIAAEDVKSGALTVRRTTNPPPEKKAPARAEPSPSTRATSEAATVSDPQSKPKTTMTQSPRTLLAAFAGWLAFGSTVDAQAAAPANAPANTAPVKLAAFEVSTDKDLGYQSTATLSGTRTGELLRNLPVSVSIINQELLNDVGLTDVMQAIALYGVGVEQNGEPGIGLNGINGGGNSLLFRGISSSWQGRDGFTWYGVSDSFNVETLEVSRGPVGNVFGDSRAGGLPNIVSKRARTQRNFGQVKVTWDSEGGHRGTLDWNRQLTSKLAARLNLLKGDSREWRDTAYDKRDGLAAAVQYDLTPRTRLNVVGEYNNVSRTPSISSLTVAYDNGYVLGTGSNAPGPAPAGTEVLAAANPTGPQRWTYIGGQLFNFTSTPAYISRASAATPAALQQPVPESVIPRHMMWNGPTQRYDHDSKSLTANLDHRFGPNTMLQAAYNFTFSDRFDYFVVVEGNSVRRDVNPTLRNRTGAIVPNPNFDQLYVDHITGDNQYYNRTASYRLTGVQDMDLGFTKQRVILSGSLRDDRFRLFFRNERLTPAAISTLGFTGTAARPVNHEVRRRFYLRNGNGDAIRHRQEADTAGFTETAGGQKSRAEFYSGSVLLFGRYWQDRIFTTVGIRRDNYEARGVAVPADPVTGLGNTLRGGSNDEQWRELIGVYGTSVNYGLVFAPQRTWRLFYNFAENFQQNGTEPYFNGDPRAPRIGDGYDFGASAYLWDDRFTATVTRFDNKANNEQVNALTAPVANEINSLLGTSYSTGLRRDTLSRRATGTEIEVIANLRPFTVRFAYSMRKNVNTDFAPRLQATLAAMRARTTNTALYALTQQQFDALLFENPAARASWNYSLRYDVASGPLKGARLGSYASYRQGRWVYPAGRPALYFKSYLPIGVFAGYTVKVTEKFRPDFQLNVDNLLNDQTRLGNGYTDFSYLAPIKFTLSSTLRF